jgi:hypothetical protein
MDLKGTPQDTLKLRLGLPPKERGLVSFSYWPRSG